MQPSSRQRHKMSPRIAVSFKDRILHDLRVRLVSLLVTGESEAGEIQKAAEESGVSELSRWKQRTESRRVWNCCFLKSLMALKEVMAERPQVPNHKCLLPRTLH